ncbi:ATP-binding protein [Glaciecola sp. HTCC2999]|uniref:nSTAND1 domain-containing NTPase n=1 Tax=Glaciecola sp. HTCC2999 TaxID=455436 RepID=UPI0000E0E58E|nr:ATP-binding protein [Glaciecola sp. HTCC2999]
MIHVLTSTGDNLKIDVRLQEVRKGDPAVTATLSLALKPILSSTVFTEQQEYLSTSAKAAYVALNKIDQRNRFKASVTFHSTSLSNVNLIAGSTSATLGYTLALFNAFWTKQLGKGEGITTPIFATGEVHGSGNIISISYLQEKLQNTIKVVRDQQISKFTICIPQSNISDISEVQKKEIEEIGGTVISANTIPELLEQLLHNEYDGEALGRWTPFKGLKSFEYEDSIRFFGRDREIERLYEDLEHNRGILIVSGPTGSGKSSLVKAGLIPKLANQKNNFNWISVTPTSLDKPLITFLLNESLNMNSECISDKTNIKALLAQPEIYLDELVLQINNHRSLFLLHIDQFEDFFNQENKHTSIEDLQLIHKITKATENIKVVLSIRNEYLSTLLESGFIASPVITNVSENLSIDAWRDIVIKQAAFSGLTFENTPENLAQRIINDAIQTPNALPMVEFVLEQLYESVKQENSNINYLRNNDYDFLGGISGAIAQRAEDAVSLAHSKDNTVHHLFSVIVGVTTDGIPYSKQVAINESIIDNNIELSNLIQSLLDSNILMKFDSNDKIVMKLTHDSLFENWARLKSWLESSKLFLDWKNTIELGYRRWQKNEFNTKHLINDTSLLNEGVEFKNEGFLLNHELSHFIKKSIKNKRNKVISNFSLFLIFPIIVAMVFWWDKNIKRSEYYAAVGYKWEVPFGVGELSAEQMKKKQFRYHFIYQGGLLAKYLGYGNKVIELRHENSLGYMSELNSLAEQKDARIQYYYKENGEIDTASTYSLTDMLLNKKSYEFSKNRVTVTFLNKNNNSASFNGPPQNHESVFFKRSNVTRIKKYFNTQGYVEKEIYQKDSFGGIGNDEFGRSGYSYSYNKYGLVNELTDISTDKLHLEKNKKRIITKYNYNSMGLIDTIEFNNNSSISSKNNNEVAKKSYIYDSYGNILKTLHFNENNTLSNNKNGVAVTKSHINKQGWIVELQFFDKDYKQVKNEEDVYRYVIDYTTEGYLRSIKSIYSESIPNENNVIFSLKEYSYDKNFRIIKTLFSNEKAEYNNSFETKYNENGNIVEQIYIDEHGQPITKENKVAKIIYEYNENNHIVSSTYYDISNALIINPTNGCAIHITDRNHLGYLLSEKCLDTQKAPTIMSDGSAGLNISYDDNGNLIKTMFLGIDEKPMIHPEYGIAGYENAYDDSGNVVRFLNLGTDEKPMIDPKYGYAGLNKSYDDNGNVIKTIYLGIDRKPMIHPEYGIVGYENAYDDSGNVVRFLNLGTDEKPMIHPKYGYAGYEKAYDDNGNVVKDFNLGTDEKLMIHPKYGYAGYEKAYDDNGNVIKTMFLGIDRKPMIYPEYGIAGYEKAYDDNGNVVKDFNLGTDEKPMIHPKYGYAGLNKSYDDNGNVIKEIYLGIDRKPMIHPEYGIAGYENAYDDNGNVVKEIYLGTDEKPMIHPKYGYAGLNKSYDDNGNVIKEIYLDTNEKPMIHPEYGIAGYENAYDDSGNVVRFLNLGTDEKPMIHPKYGYACLNKSYDDNGNVIKEIYLGIDRKPMIHPEYGIAGYENAYDDNGNVIKEIYLDTNEKPMIHPKYGIAGFVQSYDDNGNVIKEIYLGIDRKPMIHPEYGIAGYEKAYDDNGNVVKDFNLGTDEKPMIHPKYGYAGYEKAYDDNGNVVKFLNLGIDEKPMIHPEYGIAGYENAYDDSGNVVRFLNLGTDEKPMIHPKYGYACLNKSYDDNGNVIKEIYLGIDRKPMIHPEYGIAGYENAYDDSGNVVRFLNLGTDEKPMIHPEYGYAGYEKAYDDNGNVVKFLNLGIDEKPMIHPKYGYAGYEKAYDDNGNVIKEIYLDTNEKPMIHPKYGIAGFVQSYDDNGNVVKDLNLGIDKKTMIHPKYGYAGLNKSYDDNGNVIKEIYLGTDEKPMTHPKYGYAGLNKSYDDNGNVIKTIYLGTDGIPVIHPKYGDAGYEKAYDDNGNLIKIIYLGTDGKPMIHPKYGDAGYEKAYDDNGNVIKIIYLGTDGKPMIHPKGL